MPVKDLTNQKFGRLTAIRINKEKPSRLIYWECLCDCGKTKIIRGASLSYGNTLSCGCLKHDLLWKGIGELSGMYLHNIQRNAKIRGIEYNISKEYLWDLFLKQDKKCALTGMKLTHKTKWNKNRSKKDGTASLDRIDSKKGYIEGNVQWVHKKINVMKMDMSDKELLKWAKLLISYKKRVDNGN